MDTGELVLRKLDDCLGEILLYDGSFRIGLSPKLWSDKKFRKLVIKYLNELPDLQVSENT